MYTVLNKKELAPDITRLEVKAPLIAKKRKPGNFVIVRPSDKGERIPLTIVESDEERGSISLIVQAIGKSTHLINNMQEGETFADVVGPLGEPTPIRNFGTVVCVGGGVGTAVVYPMAVALKEAGNRVISIIGAKSKELVILENEMDAVSDELMVTTDDGSYGLKGFVTEALQNVLDRDDAINSVFTTGPLAMMRAVAEVTRQPEIQTYASLNPIMMDGTGMCGACRVSVDSKLKFACVDGPEFDAHQINFDELISRNNTYVDQEREALEAYHHQQQCKAEGTYGH